MIPNAIVSLHGMLDIAGGIIIGAAIVSAFKVGVAFLATQSSGDEIMDQLKGVSLFRLLGGLIMAMSAGAGIWIVLIRTGVW